MLNKVRALLHSPAAVKQVAKFLVGGLLTVAVDYLTFTVLVLFDVSLVIASIASFLAGFVVSFSINKLWVFGAKKESQRHSTRLQMTLYVALLFFNMAFTYYFIFFAEKLGVSVFIGKACTILLITAWNFVLYKKVIFKLKG